MVSAPEDSDADGQSTEDENNIDEQHDEDLLTKQNLEKCNDA